MSEIRKRAAALLLAACTAASAFAFSAVPAKAAPAYPSKWQLQIGWTDVIGAGLLKTTDADAVYRQLRNSFMYQLMSEGDLYRLAQTEGVKIPAQSLARLASEGWISGYTYKMIAGLPLAPADMADVYDASYYYANNVWLHGVIDPTDSNALFQNFLAVGMQVGAQANASFSPAAYRASNKTLSDAYGDAWANYYVNYILYHDFSKPYQG